MNLWGLVAPLVGRHRRDARGASAVEYGLLIAGVAALIVASVILFGGAVVSLFSDTCTTVAGRTGQTCR